MVWIDMDMDPSVHRTLVEPYGFFLFELRWNSECLIKQASVTEAETKYNLFVYTKEVECSIYLMLIVVVCILHQF